VACRGPTEPIRRVAEGDTVVQPIDRVGTRGASKAAEAAQGRQLAQLLGVLTDASLTGNTRTQALRDLFKGTSQDDLQILREALDGRDKEALLIDPDEELASDWREGGYPYRNLIRRFMEHLNPRGARVVALAKPSEVERGQWYFQRYVQHLPTAGEIVLFDQSWYNRAGVERVMGFCSDAEYREFMIRAPEFERHLGRSGIYVIKFWFSVSRAEQRRRFEERQIHPLKQWKLSPVDLGSLDKWDDYTRAKEAMFFETDTAEAPWTVIKSDCKKRARLGAIRYVLHKLPYERKDVERVGKIDPLIVGRAQIVYERGEKPLSETTTSSARASLSNQSRKTPITPLREARSLLTT
jgi:polyphosphate kinase 2